MRALFFLLLSIFSMQMASAQMTTMILVLKQGETIKGTGKIKANSVKFKKDSASDAQEYQFSEINLIKIVRRDDTDVYQFIGTNENPKPKLVKVIRSGNAVELFTTTSTFTSMGTPGQIGMNTNSVTNYFLRKKGEITLTSLGPYSPLTNNLKDKVSDYFSDCATLVSKLKESEFRVRRGLDEIVDFYNNSCQ